MKKYLILLSMVLFLSCNDENEYIQITKFYSEDPSSPRFAIKINNHGNVYFCLEKNPKFSFPGEETFVFDYYKSKHSISWDSLKTVFENNFLKKSRKKYQEISHSSLSASYRLDKNIGVIEDFEYLILEKNEEKMINDLIELIDTSKAKAIDYYPFNIEILTKPLPIPPSDIRSDE
jgi:hypothetical protein